MLVQILNGPGSIIRVESLLTTERSHIIYKHCSCADSGHTFCLTFFIFGTNRDNHVMFIQISNQAKRILRYYITQILFFLILSN